ncbi:MAG TPA: ISNCY family transposase [Thermomicrobiales bacterium]|nr:ISNCY family transposase [Thermomicrobiales bacterium]
MTAQEQQRVAILQHVEQGQRSCAAAAALLGMATRQLRRRRAASREQGAAGLAHGNRGRQPAHTLPAALRQQVIDLAQGQYRGCNDQHLSELLAERAGLTLSRASLRRILRAAGLPSPRQHHAPQHHGRRARYPQEGQLRHLEASPHAWFAARGPRCTPFAAIDDATNALPAARCRAVADAHGSFLSLERVVAGRGCPLAVDHDRHGIFRQTPKRDWSVAEHLAGQADPTPFGRLLAARGIASIAAQSPQATGRIARRCGTLHDRLVVELRLAGVDHRADANAFLADDLPRRNARFRVPAAQPGVASRPLDPACPPEARCCFKYRRVVAADNAVRLGEHRLQVLPTRQRASWARATVEVQERLDGRLAVYSQGGCLVTTAAPPDAPARRARGGRRAPVAPPPPPPPPRTVPASPTGPRKPAPEHPWRHRGPAHRRAAEPTAPPDESGHSH